MFLIRSGSVQKMLAALYKLIWGIQKTIWTNLFEHQGKMFLNIEGLVKACVRYFLSNFNSSPNDSPLKPVKNVFYFI